MLRNYETAFLEDAPVNYPMVPTGQRTALDEVAGFEIQPRYDYDVPFRDMSFTRTLEFGANAFRSFVSMVNKLKRAKKDPNMGSKRYYIFSGPDNNNIFK